MRPSRWPLETGFGFPLGFAAAILTTVVAVGAGATRHPAYGVAALALAVALVAMLTTIRAALATAAVAWALQDGFVLGREGGLVFTGAAATAAIVLTAVALVGTVTGSAVRLRGLPRYRVLPPPR